MTLAWFALEMDQFIWLSVGLAALHQAGIAAVGSFDATVRAGQRRGRSAPTRQGFGGRIIFIEQMIAQLRDKRLLTGAQRDIPSDGTRLRIGLGYSPLTQWQLRAYRAFFQRSDDACLCSATN